MLGQADAAHAAFEGTAVGRAISAIRAGIQQGRFGPGQRLVEGELVSSLGIGRGPVREALRRMSVDGLVELEPNRGAFVARASRAMMANMFEVREWLEGLAARRAADNLAESGLGQRLLDARANERTAGASDAATFMEANRALHVLIVQASQNQVGERVLEQLQLPQLRAAFFRLLSPQLWTDSQADHLRILDAILARDGDQAELEMRRHIRRTAELVMTLPDDVFA